MAFGVQGWKASVFRRTAYRKSSEFPRAWRTPRDTGELDTCAGTCSNCDKCNVVASQLEHTAESCNPHGVSVSYNNTSIMTQL